MSARRATRLLVGLAAAASTTLLAAPAAVAAGDAGRPGMCTGRSDPLTRLNAHASVSPKFVLNVETDSAGLPTGVLILGRGADRVYVDDICRVWQHLPGQEPDGAGEDVDETATTAHAVGLGALADGTPVLVRSDVRENADGTFFRVRYRVMGPHAGGGTTEPGGQVDGSEGEHDDEAWTRVPLEGWAPLDGMNLR